MTHKLSIYSLACSTCLAFVVVLTGCQKEEFGSLGLHDNSVTGVIAKEADFSLFNSALDKAELLQPLNDAGPFTVFAPTNSALQTGGISTATIDTVKGFVGKTYLMDLLTYHMVGDKTIQAVADNDSAKTNFATLNGKQFFVSQSSKGIVVNGAATTVTKQALNGVTYGLSKVLTVPSKSLYETLNTDSRFTILVKGITAKGLVSEFGKGNVGYAIFAPTNDAFIAAGITETNVESTLDLENILKYHVTPRVYFSGNLTTANVRTLLGKAKTIKLTSGTNVTVSDGNSNTATVTQADIITTNGVIHVIDKVLKP